MSSKVCISGYYGFDNFGDETILKILCENLKSFKNPPEITVFSSDPQKTAELYHVKSVRTFDIKSVADALKNTDCLISGGGSLLQDVTSKKSLLYYLFVIACALFFGKKVIIFAQGIGPVHNKILEKITMFLLKKAEYITVRDENGYNLLKKYKINCSLCPDPVWNIELPPGETSTNVIGIQLRQFSTLTPDFIDTLVNFTVKNYADKKIRVFSLQNKIDMPVSEEFRKKVKMIMPDIDIEVVENSSNEEVIKNLCACDELFAMRFHACLIGIKAGIKLLPISYDIKVSKLANDFNLSYIDLENPGNADDILKKFADKKYAVKESISKDLEFDFSVIETKLS